MEDVKTFDRIEKKCLITKEHKEAMLTEIKRHMEKDGYYDSEVYNIYFDTDKTLQSDVFADGLVAEGTREYQLEDGYLKITEDLFDGDALIMENEQVHTVALCLPDKTPYLTVKFDAPLVGVWSPVKKNAPFICIEPWYGRADKIGFLGELSEREWGNTLKGQESFEASYIIEINDRS